MYIASAIFTCVTVAVKANRQTADLFDSFNGVDDFLCNLRPLLTLFLFTCLLVVERPSSRLDSSTSLSSLLAALTVLAQCFVLGQFRNTLGIKFLVALGLVGSKLAVGESVHIQGLGGRCQQRRSSDEGDA